MMDYESGEHKVPAGRRLTSDMPADRIIGGTYSADRPTGTAGYAERTVPGSVTFGGRATAELNTYELSPCRKGDPKHDSLRNAFYIVALSVICITMVGMTAYCARMEKDLAGIRAKLGQIATVAQNTGFTTGAGDSWVDVVEDEAIHGWLGVTVVSGKAEGDDILFGVIVTNVVKDGPADKAGLQRGDMITAINGEPTTDAETFLSIIQKTSPKDTITVSSVSDGATETVDRKIVLVSEEELYAH